MPLSSIRAVLFDAVGTLIQSRPTVAQVYYRAGRRFGSRLPLAEVDRRFRQALARRGGGGTTDERRERQRWQNIVSDVFVDVDHAAGPLFEELWDHFARSRHWVVFDDVPASWRALERRNVILGIASNFDKRLATVCGSLEPLKRAAHVFCSSEIGYCKPHGGFFRAIEDALRLDPNEILLVGDDWEADVQGALRAGWQAILVDRNGATSNGPSIRRLDEIVTLLAPFRGPHQ